MGCSELGVRADAFPPSLLPAGIASVFAILSLMGDTGIVLPLADISKSLLDSGHCGKPWRGNIPVLREFLSDGT